MPSYKTPQVNFVCKKEQYAEIERRARQYGMSIAEYCRFVALNAEIKAEVKKESQ